MSRTYVEDFVEGPGGWIECFRNGADGVRTPERQDGALVSRGPWWVDYNHAPPGAGYLHILFALHTADGPFRSAEVIRAGGCNNFIEGGHSRDFTDARVSLSLRGELEARGARCVLLVQSAVNGIVAPWALTGQPLRVSADGAEQTLTLVPDETQWTCLGTRADRTQSYGYAPLADVLRDVNADILLILFPLNVVPLQTVEGDPYLQRAGEDYPIDRSLLPQGRVLLDGVRIESATG